MQRRNRQFGRRNNNNRGNHQGNNNRGNNNRGGGRFNVKQAENKRDNYLNLHKEHFSSDRVKAEFYLQHAEHWQRLINEHAPELMEPQRAENDEGDDYDVADDNESGIEDDASDAAVDVAGEEEVAEEKAVAPVREKRQHPPRERRSNSSDGGNTGRAPRERRPARQTQEGNDDDSTSGADISAALPGAI